MPMIPTQVSYDEDDKKEQQAPTISMPPQSKESDLVPLTPDVPHDPQAPALSQPPAQVKDAPLPKETPTLPSNPPAGSMSMASHQPLPGIPHQQRDMDEEGKPTKLIPGDQVYNPQTTRWEETPYTTHQKMNPFIGMFAHADNIHNPILRTLAKVASGIGAVEDSVAGSLNPSIYEERRKNMALPGELAEQQGRIAAQKAAVERSQAETEALKHPLPEWEKGQEITDESGNVVGQQFYDKKHPATTMTSMFGAPGASTPTAAPLPNAPTGGAAAPPIIPTTQPTTSTQSTGSKLSYGKKPTVKEGDEPASASMIADVMSRIQGNPDIPKDMAAGLAFPEGYKPTVNDVKTRLANIKEIEDAKERGDQRAINNTFKATMTQLAADNSRIMNQLRQDKIDADKEAKAGAGDYSLAGEDFINSLDPAERDLVRNVGLGLTPMPAGTIRSKAGKQLYQEVTHAFPGWDFSKSDSYVKTREKFTSGEEAEGINHLNVAIQHVGKLYDIADWANVPVVSDVAKHLPMETNAEKFAIMQKKVLDELDHVYDNKSLTDADKDEIRKGAAGISHWTAAGNRADMKALVSLLESKLEAYKQQWDNAKPSPAVPDFPIISKKSADVINRLAQESNTVEPVKSITPAQSRQRGPGLELSPAAQALVDKHKGAQ